MAYDYKRFVSMLSQKVLTQKAYLDRDRTIWVRTAPGMYRTAGSESHAKRLLDSGQSGSRLETIERLYGPLQPWEDD